MSNLQYLTDANKEKKLKKNQGLQDVREKQIIIIKQMINHRRHCQKDMIQKMI